MPESERQGDAQETETRILNAAQRVFIRRGMSGARTQEIADEAGVNRALINYYFRSKEKLADAVFARVAGSLFPNLLKTLGSAMPLPEKLARAVEIELDGLSSNPFLPLYVLSELQYHPRRLKALVENVVPVKMLRHEVLATLQEQLDEGAANGEFRPTRAEDLLVMLISLLIFPFAAAGMIENLLGLDEMARKAMIERRREDLAEFVLKGLRP